jgi:murein DD-endopeptidase MepM/ murein hydrolase activator NlpD
VIKRLVSLLLVVIIGVVAVRFEYNYAFAESTIEQGFDKAENQSLTSRLRPNSGLQSEVIYYLPYGPSSGGVRVSRTGMLYKSYYDAVGLHTTYYDCNSSSYCFGANGEYHDYNDGRSIDRGAIDFSLPYGAPVLASVAGTVDSATNMNDCQVVIQQPDGTKAYYIHVSAIHVNVGQSVNQGQHIADVGDGCGATGAHLHFAVWDGAYEIPVRFSDSSVQAHGGIIRPSRTNFVEYRYTSENSTAPSDSTLSNPSFESGNVDPWTWFDPGACNRAIYSNSTISHDGNYYLATNRNNNYDTCKSFYQDIAQTPAAGDNLRFGIWIRPRSSDLTVEGKVAVWALGGDPESENTPFSVTGSQWQCVEASLPVQNDGHDGVRTEIYLESNHSADYFFDDASFVRNGGAICPDSPTPTPSPTPDPDQGNYVYEAQPEDYVCGTTPPTDGIVEFRLRTYSSESRMRVYVRKCDRGDFSMDGYAYLEVDGQTRWGPISYQAGDSIVSWDIDPCGQFGICDDNWHEYQVYVASKGYPDEPKLAGRVDARKVEVGDPDLQIAELKVQRNDTGDYLSPGDSVPDGTSITLKEYTINCGDADVTNTFYVHYYDNGQFFDDDTEPSNVDADCDDTELESTTFDVEGVGNHTLKVSVDATDVVPESNEDNNSATFTINVTSAAVPVPTLSTISNSDGDGDYTVDWTPVANATSYELQEDDNNSFNSPSVKYNGAGTVWSASNRPADTYYYRVRACNTSDCSDWSGVQSTTVQDETLTAPTLSTISNSDGDGDYTVGWTAVANATSYELQEDDNNSFNSPSVVYNAGTVWNASNKPSGSYYYRVRACNTSECSAWSNVQSAIVQDHSLTAPTLSTISNSDGDGDYIVEWTTVANAVSYELQEDDNNSFNSPSVKYNGAGTVWNASNKLADTYYYRVRACNSTRCSVWSNSESVTVNIDPEGTQVFVDPAASTGYVGSSLTLDIVISDVVNLGSFEFVFAYDPALVSIEEVTLGSFPESTGRDFSVVGPNDDGSGSVTFGAYSMGSVPSGAEGVGALAQLKLNLLATGQTSLGLDAVQVATVPGDSVTVSVRGADLEIGNCLGDFDGDGEVKIADVQKIAYRWNTSSGDELYDPQYDLDSDGEINILDVQKVAYRWGTVCGTARQNACVDETIAETVALEIRPDPKEVQVGDTFTMGVVISDVVNLGAYEFTLGYDSELFQVTNVALGSFPESTGRDFIEVGPEISPTLGTVSFGAYSQGGTPEGPSGRGQVAVLTLEALKKGSDTLAFDDIQVADIGGTPQDVGSSSGSEVSVSDEENDYVYLPIVISR